MSKTKTIRVHHTPRDLLALLLALATTVLLIVNLQILFYQRTLKVQLVEAIVNQEKSSGNCSLVPNPGPCDAHIVSYYFNNELGSCDEFVWGGCDGIRPFETKEKCLTECSY